MVREIIVNFLELLTLVSSIALGLLVLLFVLKFVFRVRTKLYDGIVHFLQDNYLVLGFIVSLTAMLGSLFYSDLMGYDPCRLCWYQRIFMYPQAFFFFISMKVKNKAIVVNSLVLSVIGAFIAGYHYMMQIGVVPEGGCDVIGYSASCSDYFSVSYGFITIPMMAFIAFVILIILGYGKIRELKVGER
jgi:disulfide bond formation protein DsbB